MKIESAAKKMALSEILLNRKRLAGLLLSR
jgi:hypothetical protein